MPYLLLIPLLAWMQMVTLMETFFTVSMQTKLPTLARYVSSRSSVRLQNEKAIEDWPAAELTDQIVVHTLLSPDSKWLAVGLMQNSYTPDGQYLATVKPVQSLVVVDTKRYRVAFHLHEEPGDRSRWFDWDDTNHLLLLRRVGKDSVPGEEQHALYTLSAPDWVVSAEPSEPPSSTVELPPPRYVRDKIQTEGAALFLEYTPYAKNYPTVSPSWIPMAPTPTWWGVLLRIPNYGDVSKDGHNVAIVARRDDKRMLVLFTSVRTKKEYAPQNTHVLKKALSFWLVRFWQNWLVVGTYKTPKERTLEFYTVNNDPHLIKSIPADRFIVPGD